VLAIIEEGKWELARIIRRGEVMYYSTHRTQYNLEQSGAGFEQYSSLSIAIPFR
jgi:hypothetical protein